MQFQTLKNNFKRLVRPGQKKIILIFAAVLALVILEFGFYRPSRNQLKKTKTELIRLEEEIKSIEEVIGYGPLREDKIKAISERLIKLENKFPHREGESLRQIADLARKFDINLTSIRPQLRQAVIDEKGNPVMAGRKPCESLFVSYQLQGSFFNLVDYLEALRKDIPAAILVEVLDIQRPGSLREKLRVNLGVKIFLLSENDQ